MAERTFDEFAPDEDRYGLGAAATGAEAAVGKCVFELAETVFNGLSRKIGVNIAVISKIAVVRLIKLCLSAK